MWSSLRKIRDNASSRYSRCTGSVRTSAPRGNLPSPEEYYDLLGPVCSRIDIWHITYNHALPSPQAIVEWFKGSALQPYLSALDAPTREQFLAAYGEKIAAAYKPRFDGKVLLRFPRLFIVAVR